MDTNQKTDNSDKQKIEEDFVYFSPHPSYPSISSAIDIKFETRRGRFGIAAKDIEVGETLIFESPVAAKTKITLTKDHCEHCLR